MYKECNAGNTPKSSVTPNPIVTGKNNNRIVSFQSQ